MVKKTGVVSLQLLTKEFQNGHGRVASHQLFIDFIQNSKICQSEPDCQEVRRQDPASGLHRAIQVFLPELAFRYA